MFTASNNNNIIGFISLVAFSIKSLYGKCLALAIKLLHDFLLSTDGGNFIISVANTEPASPSSMDVTIPTISLPGTLFERIDDTSRTGLVFTLYGESTLFPVRNSTNNSATRTVVGSRIIAANVAQRNTVFEDLSEPVVVLLPLEIGDVVSTSVVSDMHPSAI